MNTQQSSHQRLAALYAARRDTWDTLREEAEARGVSVMEVVRERQEAEAARWREAAERVQESLANPAVRRALREGHLPTPADFADPSPMPEEIAAGPERQARWQAQCARSGERGEEMCRYYQERVEGGVPDWFK